MMTPFFYRRGGDAFVPSELATSPWQPGKQNGVALGGLATHLLEGIPAPAPMTVARLTIDILAAAPLAPTVGRCRVIRQGRQIQMVEAELLVADRVVARATALRVRAAETPSFEEAAAYPGPETVPMSDFMGRHAFGGTLETRVIRGGIRQTGAGTLWARFGHEHVTGEPLTPLVRAAVLGDFGGGLGSVLDRERWTFANLDIALHFTRPPVGEWLLIDASTASAGNGLARSDTVLADTAGSFARGHQCLFVAPR